MLLQNKIAVVTGGGIRERPRRQRFAFATRSVFRGDYMRSSYAC